MSIRQRILQALNLAPEPPLPSVVPPVSVATRSLDFGGLSGVGVVNLTAAGQSDMQRLFRKRDVVLLRNYAEHSVWVRAAIDIYRNAIANAEWQIRPADKDRRMDKQVAARVTALLNSPNNAVESFADIKAKQVEDYLVVGHGGYEFLLQRNLEPYGVRPLDAARLGFVEGWDGTDRRRPRYAEFKPQSTTPARWLAHEQVLCLVNRPRSYNPLGLSHVEVLDLTVRALLEGDDVMLNQLIEPMPGGALNLGNGATLKQVEQVRADIQSTKKAFVVMGGTEGMNYVRFDASPAELQMLDKQTWFVRQVAAVFQVSTAALRLAVDTSRANTEAMFENDTEGVGALMVRLRALENLRLVGSFGNVAAHNCYLDYPVMHARDAEKQARIAEMSYPNGAWASLNETRRKTGEPELDKAKFPLAEEILIDTPYGLLPLSMYQELLAEARDDLLAKIKGENADAAPNKPPKETRADLRRKERAVAGTDAE